MLSLCKFCQKWLYALSMFAHFVSMYLCFPSIYRSVLHRGVLQDLHYILPSFVFEMATMHSLYIYIFFFSVNFVKVDIEGYRVGQKKMGPYAS